MGGYNNKMCDPVHGGMSGVGLQWFVSAVSAMECATTTMKCLKPVRSVSYYVGDYRNGNKYTGPWCDVWNRSH